MSRETVRKRVVKDIIFAGDRFGVFILQFDQKYQFSIEEEELLELLVKQTAVAILNAKFAKQLVNLKYQSEETSKSKIGFLANLSHEIRGPLGTILNAVEIVLAKMLGEISEPQEKTLQMVKSNGDHLLDLITDCLLYTSPSPRDQRGSRMPSSA